jgi:hypothetical protein
VLFQQTLQKCYSLTLLIIFPLSVSTMQRQARVLAHRVQRRERLGWFCVCFWVFAASQSTHTRHITYTQQNNSAKNELQNWSSAAVPLTRHSANEPFHWRICGRNPFDHGLVVNDPGNTSSLTREREEKEKKDFPFVVARSIAAGGERTDRPTEPASAKSLTLFVILVLSSNGRAINYPKDARALFGSAFHLTPLIYHKFSALLALKDAARAYGRPRRVEMRCSMLLPCVVSLSGFYLPVAWNRSIKVNILWVFKRLNVFLGH